jgi:uncharacterized protein YkwD
MPQQNPGRRGLRRAALLLATTLLALGLSASRASADIPTPISNDADWLTTVNFYRSMAGVPAVVNEPLWTQGELNHSKYIAENPPNAVHEEDPNNPWYTASGDEAGRNGNVANWFQTPPPVSCKDRRMVELWMAAPFHAVAIVDPRLQKSAFGVAFSGDTAWCGATLDVFRGRTGTGPTSPVFFPRNGTTTPLLQFGGNEFPDPFASCPGFSAPTGPVVLLQLTANPGTTSASLLDNGSPVTSCSFDENTYATQLGRDILAARHAIVVLPRSPLMSGHTYTVQISTTSASPADAPSAVYTWSYKACAAGQTGGACEGATAVALQRASATRTRAGVLVRWRTASEGQTLGFNVYRVRQGKLVKLNRALIASVFGGTATGHAYSWLDRGAPRGSTTLAYRLQAVGLDGTRRWVGRAST